MRKIILTSILLLVFLIPLVSSASVSVGVTKNKQLAFSLTNDEQGYFLTHINIYDDKNSLIYETERNIFYTDNPSFQTVNCSNCKAGSYSVIANIGNATAKTNFTIPKNNFDMFWIIIIVLILILTIFTRFLRREKLNISSNKTIKKSFFLNKTSDKNVAKGNINSISKRKAIKSKKNSNKKAKKLTTKGVGKTNKK